MELIDKDSLLNIFFHCYPPYLLSYKIVCKKWNLILTRDFLIKRLCFYYKEEMNGRTYCCNEILSSKIMIKFDSEYMILIYNYSNKPISQSYRHHPGTWMRSDLPIHKNLKSREIIFRTIINNYKLK